MISVFGWPDPNTGSDQSEHALYTCYFIKCFISYVTCLLCVNGWKRILWSWWNSYVDLRGCDKWRNLKTLSNATGYYCSWRLFQCRWWIHCYWIKIFHNMLVRAPSGILLIFSRGKSILPLNCPWDVQYSNSKCWPAHIFVSFGQHFFFRFTIKLLYCQKWQTFKFAYSKNNFYHQKIYKKSQIRHYYGYPGVSSSFWVIAASRWEKT